MNYIDFGLKNNFCKFSKGFEIKRANFGEVILRFFKAKNILIAGLLKYFLT
jgi:hypothetical protein